MSDSEKPLRPEDLPDLQESRLDEATLDQLFVDLEGLAQIIEVQLKGAPQKMADGRDVPLAEAHGLLKSGGVCGVQIRYVHGGTLWWDTIMRLPEGFRLVRIQPDPPEVS
jgi:hypothetical protein